MAIYTPYFYIIQDTRNGMYYAGAKWAEGCHPDQLLKEGGYPTSSETIKKIIDENGLNTFIIRKIRTFETGDEAYDYETRFLIRIDARNHLRFYNGHNNDGILPGYGSKKHRVIIKERYGVDNVFQLETVKKKIRKTNFQRYGVEHPSYSEELLEKKAQNNMKKIWCP